MKGQDSNAESLHEKFKREKQTTIAVTEAFLSEAHEAAAAPNPALYRNAAVRAVASGDITKALQNLERARDAKNGIIMHDRVVAGVPVTIRDARNVATNPVRGTEAFEMQYLNTIRAALDIAELDDPYSSSKEELRSQLKIKAQAFARTFAAGQIQKELSEKLAKEIKGLATLLERFGVKNVYEKLNVAKDFQNFNDKHSNVVTLSSIEKDGVKHTVVEAEVAMKGLTETQKAEYKSTEPQGRNRRLPDPANTPSWYQALTGFERSLCTKYASTIAAGQHVIPTQLRQLAGMKNAFEKTTAVLENGELVQLHASKHAGTLASLSKNKKIRQDVTNENARQAKEWIGPDKVLHCNTLNAAYVPLAKLFKNEDPEIVRRTKDAMINLNDGSRLTNTSFNRARWLDSAHDLQGVKDTLKSIENSLNPNLDSIKSFLQPKGFFGRVIRRLKIWNRNPMAQIDKLVKESEIDLSTAAVLRDAIALRKAIEKVGSVEFENSSLSVSTKLNRLTNAISGLPSKPKGMSQKPPIEEMLTMCASGKDRTGLAEHDLTAQLLADKFGILIRDVDRQLLRAGHTAQQAGGINAGGGTIGCYGTKGDNRAAIPYSRPELDAIMELSSESNKIKGKSTLKEQSEQDLMEPDPIMPKNRVKATRNNEPEVINQRLEPSMDGESFIYTTEQNRAKPDPVLPKHEVEVHNTESTITGPATTPKGTKQPPKSRTQDQQGTGRGPNG